MLIFSQDRKKIVDCFSVTVTRNFGGGKDGKYAIVGTGDLGVSFDGVLGTYADEKTAMDELEKIFAAFENGEKSYRL
ncbi:MAG: hypothetical protein SPD47_07375 [Oscillospiraceae bacterium]|nr:hypothetical protein [Oscillospiraceae bacterium]